MNTRAKAGRTAMNTIFSSTLGISFVALLLNVLLCCPAKAMMPPALTAIYNTQGMFGIVADNLKEVIEARINIVFQSNNPNLAQVSGTSLVTTTSTITPNNITLKLVSKKPMSGHVLLAIAKIQGSIIILTGELILKNNQKVPLQGSIINPTQEQLAEIAAERARIDEKEKSEISDMTDTTATANNSDASSTNQSDAAAPLAAQPDRKTTPQEINNQSGLILNPQTGEADAKPTVVKSANSGADKSRESEELPRSLSFAHRESLFDRFRASSGERTKSMLSWLLERSEADVMQSPPLLLSDGISSLKLTLRANGEGKQSFQFFISGGNCINLNTGENGAWVLEIIPKRGALIVSVIVLAGDEAIEHTLAVVPPLELFDATAAGTEQALFVKVANELARSIALK